MGAVLFLSGCTVGATLPFSFVPLVVLGILLVLRMLPVGGMLVSAWETLTSVCLVQTLLSAVILSLWFVRITMERAIQNTLSRRDRLLVDEESPRRAATLLYMFLLVLMVSLMGGAWLMMRQSGPSAPAVALQLGSLCLLIINISAAWLFTQ